MTESPPETKARSRRQENKIVSDPLCPFIRDAMEDNLQKLGIDTHDPAEQRADMLYLRRLRRFAEEFHRVAFKVVSSVVLSAILYALWQGIVARFKGG